MKDADFGALDLLIQGATIGICASPVDRRDDSLALAVEAIPSPTLIGFFADKRPEFVDFKVFYALRNARFCNRQRRCLNDSQDGVGTDLQNS